MHVIKTHAPSISNPKTKLLIVTGYSSPVISSIFISVTVDLDQPRWKPLNPHTARDKTRMVKAIQRKRIRTSKRLGKRPQNSTYFWDIIITSVKAPDHYRRKLRVLNSQQKFKYWVLFS